MGRRISLGWASDTGPGIPAAESRSTFWFEVPLTPAKSEGAEDARVSEEGPNRDSLEGRVLLVEDNPVNADVARAMLRQLGLVVDLACGGAEALECLRERRYEAILMDCHMPEVDGFEATRRIRALEREAPGPFRVPVIAVTADSFEGDRERCLESGMDDYLSKPFKRFELAAVIERWIPRS